MEASPKKFVVRDLARIGSSNMQLEELSSRNTFVKVSVAAKVIGVEKPVKVSGGITKQEVTIADASSAARLIRRETPSPKWIRLDLSREELRELMREVAREVRAEQPPATTAGPGSSEAEERGK